jgi:hypothetical protein
LFSSVVVFACLIASSYGCLISWNVETVTDVLTGPQIDERSEMWLEEAEEFGMMLMSFGKSCDHSMLIKQGSAD